jgi:hypothetical protein
MGLSKRSAPLRYVVMKSPRASISRVASENAPSSTSVSGAAPRFQKNSTTQ